jgi:hypothetical protein
MLLLLKLVLVPTLVGGVTLAARRWGLRVGGLLTALPMVAGPALCFYAIEQGNGFAASAARTTLLGIVGTAAFCVAYAWSARRANWFVSLLAGWLAFALTGALIYRVRLGGLGEPAVAVAGLLIANRLMPSSSRSHAASQGSRWDLPVRMGVAAMLVVVLTALAHRLGPQLSGILTAFPVATVVIGVFTQVQRGHESVAAFLRGLLRGLHSFVLFCLVFSTTLGPLGLPLLPSVVSALLAQLTFQTLLLWWMSRQPTQRLAGAENDLAN